jgi:AraC-like DNA-binding protein
MAPGADDFTTDDFTSVRFSTESLPVSRRISMWKEMLDNSVRGRRVFSPLWDRRPQVEVAVHRLGRGPRDAGAQGGICVMRMMSTVYGECQWTPDASSDDDVMLYIQQAGRRVLSQQGREATVSPGGGILELNAEPSTHVLLEPVVRFVTVGAPRKLMMAFAPRLEDALVRPLPPDAGILRLLTRYLDVLEDEQALRTAELQRTAATHIQDLVALAIGATRDAAEVARGRGLRAARLRAIKAEIALNLANDEVSAAALARTQRVSPRYIHKLFEDEGTTLSRYVMGQRLVRVHRMLTDPRYADLTIGAMAYSVGFSDLSTFNREFRRHFGATPSDVRAAARTDQSGNPALRKPSR